MAKVDWLPIKSEYLSNASITLKQLAEKYGLAQSTVENKAAAEKWSVSRKEVTEKSIQLIEGEIVDERADANKRHTTIYRNMQKFAQAQLTMAYKNLESYLAEHPNDVEFDFKNNKKLLGPYNMKALYESLKLAIEGERVTLNLPITVTRNEITGADGNPLFEETNTDELYNLVERTAKALAEANSPKDSEPSISPSKSPSKQ